MKIALNHTRMQVEIARGRTELLVQALREHQLDVQVALRSDAVLLAIRGAAPELQVLPVQPPLESTARFGLVTLARRTEHLGVSIVRELMDRHMA